MMTVYSSSPVAVVLGVTLPGTTMPMLTLDMIATSPGIAVSLPLATAWALYQQAVGALLALLPVLRPPASPGADHAAGDDHLLTAREVAERLGVRPSAVYELARTGGLPTVKVGKYVRISPVALRQWLAEREAKPLSIPQLSRQDSRYEGHGAPAPSAAARANAGRVRRGTRNPLEHSGPIGARRDGDSRDGRAPGRATRRPPAAPASDEASDETRW